MNSFRMDFIDVGISRCSGFALSLPLICLIHFFTTIWFVELASAAEPKQMPARVNLALCPEYPYGKVNLNVFFTIGEGTERFPAQVITSTVDSQTNQAIVDVLLPRAYANIPLYVAATCSSSFGESVPSAKVAVSNCNYLALIDSDRDGLNDAQEDKDCNEFYGLGDFSNANNADSDGDFVRDAVEVFENTDPSNPGSSPRPYILHSGIFDPNGDGNSNAVVFRQNEGNWYIRDYDKPGAHAAIQFGLNGDVPFTYKPRNGKTDIGVVRRVNNDYVWFFHGKGFQKANGESLQTTAFGLWGDNLIPGPWEDPSYTNPAVARLYDNHWYFYWLRRDGKIGLAIWGGNGDLPKVQDYDGDGIFDVALYRPWEKKTYVVFSKTKKAGIFEFGTRTCDHSARGDVTGDGIDDLIFWEPTTGIFTVVKSDLGFNTALAKAKKSQYYAEEQLGLYYVHLPLSFNRQGSKVLLTVVDHRAGYRYWRDDNVPTNPVRFLQWGLAGDAQG